MNILMLDNTASIGWNMKRGLEKKGHKCDLVFTKNHLIDGVSDKKSLKEYDVTYINQPNEWWKLAEANQAKKLVLHWHGTEVRQDNLPLSTRFFIKKRMRKLADLEIVSTPDLNWWVNGAEYLPQCVDTDVFKPMGKKRKQRFVFGRGSNVGVNRDKVPDFLNSYKEFTVYPNLNLSPRLLSVSALEALSCGCKVTHHLDKDRDWVKKYASIPAVTRDVLRLIEKGCED